MEDKNEKINTALAAVFNGFLDLLDDPQIVDAVVAKIASRIEAQGTGAPTSEIVACPFTALSIECSRRLKKESAEEGSAALNSLNNPYLLGFMKISHAVTSTLDYQEILKNIVKEVTAIFGAKGCSLQLLDKSGKKLERVADFGLSEQYVQKGPLDKEESVAGASSGAPFQIYDAQTDPRVQYPLAAAHEGIGSMLFLPVKIRDNVIGGLRIFTTEKRKFHDAEISYGLAVAEQCGIAIQNALRYTEGEEKYKSLREEVSSWLEYCAYKPS